MAFSGFTEISDKFAKMLCFNIPSPFFSLSHFFHIFAAKIQFFFHMQALNLPKTELMYNIICIHVNCETGEYHFVNDIPR